MNHTIDFFSLKTLYYIAFCIAVIGCQVKEQSESKPNTSKKSRAEFGMLQNMVYSPEEVVKHDNTKIYGIECPGECHVQSLFSERNGVEKTIPKKQYEELITLLNNPESYGAVTSACYHPSVGIITYNEHDIPLSYIGICLTCNNHESNIDLNVNATKENDFQYGYSPEGRKQIRDILSTLGFDETDTFSSFDHKNDYIKYLEGQGYSEEEINDEVKGYEILNEQ